MPVFQRTHHQGGGPTLTARAGQSRPARELSKGTQKRAVARQDFLNPNVFLEIGFALAHNRPTILVANTDVTLPFDVSGQRCIRYGSITQLSDRLQREIAALKSHPGKKGL
jgi:hypothetical protein